jgi:hypothetical protein
VQAEDRAEARVAATNGGVDELQALGVPLDEAQCSGAARWARCGGAWRGAPGPAFLRAVPLEEAT